MSAHQKQQRRRERLHRHEQTRKQVQRAARITAAHQRLEDRRRGLR
jgi:hypothetical protein